MPDRNGLAYQSTWVPGRGFVAGNSYPQYLQISSRPYAPNPNNYRAGMEVELIPGFETATGTDELTVEIVAGSGVLSNDYPGGEGSYESYGYYRYGFNGKENDNEVKGSGNQQDYGMRIYDPRLGRFLSVDPIADEFPMLAPYQFASNNPIVNIDLDGLEGESSTTAGTAAGTAAGGTVLKNGTNDLTKQLAEKACENVAKNGGSQVGKQVIKKVGTTAIIGLLTSPVVLLTTVFTFAPSYGGLANPEGGGYFKELMKPKIAQKDEPVPLTIKYDPNSKPPSKNGQEGYYVYRTIRAVKDDRDLVVGALPYFGITKDIPIGGRYSSGSIEGQNIQILAWGNYDQAKGAEQALISLNSPSGPVPGTSVPLLSTSIDNLINSNSDPVKVDLRLPLGKALLNLEQPGWETKFKEIAKPKGSSYPKK